MNLNTKKNLGMAAMAVLIFTCGFTGGFAVKSFTGMETSAKENRPARQENFMFNEEDSQSAATETPGEGMMPGEGGIPGSNGKSRSFADLYNSLSDEQKAALQQASGKSDEELAALNMEEWMNVMQNLDEETRSSLESSLFGGRMQGRKGRMNGQQGQMGEMPSDQNQEEKDFTIGA